MTDSAPPETSLPSNLSIVRLTRQSLLDRIEQKFGISVDLDIPYKLCDLKPMLGFLFAEELAVFDFWGYFDIDQVFTRAFSICLRRFFGTRAEVFNTHTHWAHGPLMIFRNSRKTRRLFLLSKHWREVLESPQYRGFDEFGREKLGLLSRRVDSVSETSNFLCIPWRELVETDRLECFTTVLAREYQAQKLTLYVETTCLENLDHGQSVFIDQDRILRNDGVVFPVYHWVIDKKRRKFHYPNWRHTPQRYLVTRYGFFDQATPRKNLMIAISRLARASGLLVRDRTLHSAKLVLHRLGSGCDPGEFK